MTISARPPSDKIHPPTPTPAPAAVSPPLAALHGEAGAGSGGCGCFQRHVAACGVKANDSCSGYSPRGPLKTEPRGVSERSEGTGALFVRGYDEGKQQGEGDAAVHTIGRSIFLHLVLKTRS